MWRPLARAPPLLGTCMPTHWDGGQIPPCERKWTAKPAAACVCGGKIMGQNLRSIISPFIMSLLFFEVWCHVESRADHLQIGFLSRFIFLNEVSVISLYHSFISSDQIKIQKDFFCPHGAVEGSGSSNMVSAKPTQALLAYTLQDTHMHTNEKYEYKHI